METHIRGKDRQIGNEIVDTVAWITRGETFIRGGERSFSVGLEFHYWGEHSVCEPEFKGGVRVCTRVYEVQQLEHCVNALQQNAASNARFCISTSPG